MSRRETFLWVAILFGVLLAWLWPLGIGGRMPIGGDVTQFSIGLMGFLGDAIRRGRLPLWNDLWGYGFPGLAESQMGVYYPLHLVLYGAFSTELAYTASLMLHTLWAGLGTAWAARRFGASAPAAILAAVAWSTCGFFVIHLPHQWGYTVGSWMPWAFGLAWPLARGVGTTREALWLALVLAIQTLPGHFQLAFITEVGVLALGVWGLFAALHGYRAAWLGLARILFAVVAVPLLAAAQIVPTFELAERAQADRTFEYLSGFAASPLHLISYVAPKLFHASPLWRPVAWDPFHTSPEEHLAYVGVVPWILAVVSMVKGIRRDPTTQALTLVIVATLLLSLGPYAPGFEGLIRLPGFSFFRAPARWGIATQLALVLLAARGFDALRSGGWPAPGRILVASGLVAASLIASVVGLVELAFWSRAQPIDHPVAAGIESASDRLPWRDPTSFRAVLDRASRPSDNPIVINALIRRGESPSVARLDRDRRSIYAEELGPTILLLTLIVVVGLVLGGRPSWLAFALAVLTVGDLLILGHQIRQVETGPIRPLASQSPVLAALAKESRGTRVISDLGNLPILVGVDALPAYRTLDRPVLEQLTLMAAGDPRASETGHVQPALRAAGVGIRVFPRREVDALVRRGHSMDWNDRPPVEIRDPSLARWTFGRRGVELLGSDVEFFLLWRPLPKPSRAWFLPTLTEMDAERLKAMDDTPGPIFERLDAARPLPWKSNAPERMEVEVDNEVPGFVLVSQLDEPGWRAFQIDLDGREHSIPIVSLFVNRRGAGWQGISVPEPGRRRIRLEYQDHSAILGLGVSGVAWSIWSLAYWKSGSRRMRVTEDGGKHEGATR